MLLEIAFALALAQPKAPRPPQAPPIAVEKVGPPKAQQMSDDYAKLRARAVEQGKPFVCFVGVDKRPITGAVVCYVPKMEGRGPGIMIGTPAGERQTLAAYLPANATDLRIRQAAGLESVPAIPFFKRIQDRRDDRRTADGDKMLRQLPFLADLEPYDTASRVQFSFRRWSGYISSVPRSHGKSEWNTAGGLTGFRVSTQLYRNAKAEVSLGYQPDGAITWQPYFVNGSIFAEEIRNESGTIFEIRVAEKNNGKWDRYVSYRDRGAYPEGYVPIKAGACQGCHARAGETAYGGSPAIPGGDTIFSAPIPQVESGETVQGGYGLQL